MPTSCRPWALTTSYQWICTVHRSWVTTSTTSRRKRIAALACRPDLSSGVATGVLGNYFHSHVLRINGHDCDDNILLSARELACLNAITVEKKGRDIILSARELDCLQWAAAGKTAWEASVILGITERTVRFHLNAAREKLACATTTQAVAKAVLSQLIHV